MVFRVLLWFSALGLHAQQPSQATSPVTTSSWLPVGPAGGDARAFGSVPGDPTHLYLGTTNSWLYESTDAGAHWHRLAMIDDSGHLILDHIVVDAADPATLFVAAWKDGTGGLWISHDRGKSFGEVMSLHDQSIRSFLQAPNNPKLLLAGTLQGVYRSTDEGATWTAYQPSGKHRDPRGRVARRRSFQSRCHLCGHLASPMEDRRRWPELAQRQAGHHRRLRCLLHRPRS